MAPINRNLHKKLIISISLIIGLLSISTSKLIGISSLVISLVAFLGFVRKRRTKPAVTPEPTVLDEPGSFAVKTFDTRFSNERGNYSATIYYPDSSDTFPAVVVSPGLGAIKSYYKWIGNHLASHGYIVMIFTVPMPFIPNTNQQAAGFASAFDLLREKSEIGTSPIHHQIDMSKRGILGHSLGGDASLRAGTEIEVDAIVSLAPAPLLKASTLKAISAPTQIQAATLDGISGVKPSLDFYKALVVKPRQLINIHGGNHVSFNDANGIAEVGGNSFDCAATIDTLSHHQRLSRRYYTAWFNLYLKNDQSMKTYLFGEVAQKDLDSQLLTMLRFEC